MRMTIAFVLLAAASFITAPAYSADKIETGTIERFECGDNCYLIIKTKSGEELTGLCTAEACTKWNEEAAMPDDLIGKQVEVSVGIGQQYDGSGSLMGDFPAFTAVTVK